MQDPEVPAAFHDASACFSEEEWKLLQDWQKELCRNVMKEIHKALISLDLPLLEADQCSQKEEPVSFSIDYLGAELRDGDAEPDHGYEVVSFCVKEEEEASGGKNPGSRRIKRTRSPMSTVLPQYKQRVTRKVIDTVQNREPDDQRMTRKKKDEDALKDPAKRLPQKTVSERINMMVFPSCDKEEQLRNLIWEESYPERIEENTSYCESILNYPGHVNIHQGTGGSDPGRGGSEQYVNCNSNLRNSHLCKDLEITEQDQKIYMSSTDKNYCVKGDYTRHLKVHSRERPYACTECKKRFFQKTHLIVHCRIHSGEKPYMCTFCHKRFNRKDYLNEHIRIHTGERPYKCTECEKSFIQKSHLVYHQRKHTGSFKNSILRD
ncbi:uncharacterized protein LOC144782523 isoform X2 [Lissotriton helveticus]